MPLVFVRLRLSHVLRVQLDNLIIFLIFVQFELCDSNKLNSYKKKVCIRFPLVFFYEIKNLKIGPPEGGNHSICRWL